MKKIILILCLIASFTNAQTRRFNYLVLPAGTAGANTAPLKLTLGTLNTTAEIGAFEFSTVTNNNLYFTPTAGSRSRIMLTSAAGGTNRNIPFYGSNQQLGEDNLFFYSAATRLNTPYLTITGASTTNPPIFLTTGVLLTTPSAGAIEYNTPRLFFTNGASIRQEIPQIQQTRNTSLFAATNNVTLANLTFATVKVSAGKTYKISGVLYTTSNVAGGVKFALGGTATATNLILEGMLTDAGIVYQSRVTTMNTAFCDVTAVTAGKLVIDGLITVSAAGTLLITFAQNALAGLPSNVLIGSNFQIQEMN